MVKNLISAIEQRVDKYNNVNPFKYELYTRLYSIFNKIDGTRAISSEITDLEIKYHKKSDYLVVRVKTSDGQEIMID